MKTEDPDFFRLSSSTDGGRPKAIVGKSGYGEVSFVSVMTRHTLGLRARGLKNCRYHYQSFHIKGDTVTNTLFYSTPWRRPIEPRR